MKLAILGTGLVALKLNEYLKNDGYLADIYSSRKNKKFLDYKELENNEYDVVFGCLDGEKTKEIYPKVKAKIFIDTIKQIMNTNNGMISTRMIEPLNINRQYLSIMENNNDIEKVSRGIYLSPSVFEDSYFSFQQKYKKAI